MSYEKQTKEDILFSLDDFKNIVGLRNFIKGRAYCNNNRIILSGAKIDPDNIYTVNAVVRGSKEYSVTLVIDISSGDIKHWSCICPDSADHPCKHISAAGIYLHNNMTEISSSRSADKQIARSVSQDLGLSDIMCENSGSERQKYVVIFCGFNIIDGGRNENLPSLLQASRAFRFSLKITVSDDLSKGIMISKDMIQRYPGRDSLFLEYVSCNGVYTGGLYYFGQVNLDAVFALASGLEKVMYGDPPAPLLFPDDEYRPTITATSRTDGSIQLSDDEVKILIPGKYTLFVLKENKVMKASDKIPYSFIKKLNGKPVLKNESFRVFEDSILPNLKDIHIVKRQEIGESKITITKSITPDIYIYIKYDKDTDEIYIIPAIKYDDIYSVNPFSGKEINNFSNFYSRSSKFKSVKNISLPEHIIRFTRDIYKEHSVYKFFMGWPYLVPDNAGKLMIKSGEAIYSLFSEIIPDFPQGWRIFYNKELENLRPKKEDVKFDFDFIPDNNNGLLEFDIAFHCGNLNIDEGQLREYIKNNKRLLENDGNYIEIANQEQLMKLFALIRSFDRRNDSGRYTVGLYHASELTRYAANDQKKDDEKLKTFIYEMENARPVEDVQIPDNFNNILRDYQKDGVSWMHFLHKYRFGGILADDMGLGKTFQALVTVSMLSHGKTSLIVCPKTLIYNWSVEIEKFAPSLKVLLVQGNSKQRRNMIQLPHNNEILITSYPLLQRDIDIYKKMVFEYCIIDEAQNIKNPETQNAKAVKSVNASHKLALTGTPIENSAVDLWSVFDYVMPGFLGNESSFRSKYADISAAENKDLMNDLNCKIKPFLLRRTKKEILKDLPPKIEQVSYSQLTAGQLAVYTDMLERIRSELYAVVLNKGFKNSQIEILAGLTRLRQICNHPGLVNEKFLNLKNISGKLDLYEELLEECMEGGHRVLVFSQFTKMLDILQHQLDRKKTGYCRLDGKSNDRGTIIERFNSDDSMKVFLISLKAGGVGLNLTAADTVILYDPWWNPMAEDQASDRAHRIGQHKTVNVYRLITKGTIEEKIQMLQVRKRLIFNSIINETGEFVRKMSWDDIKELLN
jgi:superfamily II DNA or RNA helicase